MDSELLFVLLFCSFLTINIFMYLAFLYKNVILIQFFLVYFRLL